MISGPSKHLFSVIDLTSMGTINYKKNKIIIIIVKCVVRTNEATGRIDLPPNSA
jgi:hypothetical protein